jgi:flagellar basal-body rod protein FlgB
VLSQNIANSDTPGYRPTDLAPLDFRGVLRTQGKLEIAQTRPGHIGVSLRAPGAYAVVTDKTGEASPDGNAVDLEDQMVKMTGAQMDHQLVTNLYRKHVGMIKAALGRT